MNLQAPRPWGQEETAAIIKKATALKRECEIIEFPTQDIARYLPPKPADLRKITPEDVSAALASPADFLALLNRIGDGLDTFKALFDEATGRAERIAIEEERPLSADANDAAVIKPEAPKAAQAPRAPAPRRDDFDTEAIKAQNPIVEFMAARVEGGLKKRGREYVGRCFSHHPDQNPSLSVNPDKGIFLCRSCRVTGDVIKFVEIYHGVEFPEACRILSGDKIAPLSPERAAQAAAERIARLQKDAEEEAKRHTEVAATANDILDAGTEEGAAEHDYIKRKGIQPHGALVGTWTQQWEGDDGVVRTLSIKGALLIPMRAPDGKIANVQAIFPDKENALGRDKDYLCGGRTKGCLWTIGNLTEIDGRKIIIIAEGFATAASIHEPTGLACVVAFTAGNLRAVAEHYHQKYPDALIVIAGDDDRWKDPKKNPGRVAAIDAATAVNGVAVLPVFKNTESKPTDWNDLAGIEGTEAVKSQIMAAIEAKLRRDAEPEPTTTSTESELDLVRQGIVGAFDDIAQGNVVLAPKPQPSKQARATASGDFTEDDINKVRDADPKWHENDANEAALQLAVLGERHPEWGIRYGRLTDETGLGKRALNAWIKEYRDKLRRAASARKAVENAKTCAESGKLILNPRAPYQTATTYLDMKHVAEGLRTLHFHRGDFYAYAGTHYREAEQDMLKQGLYRFLNEAYQPDDSDELKPFNPDRNKVNDVFDAMRAETALSKEINAPAWLGDADVPAQEMIPCHNGLLNPMTRALASHTPEFFSPTCLEFDYDEKAPKPVEWLKFLDQLWGSDKESIETLQQMFGYLLTCDTSQQKIFMFLGPRRCGKGTIGRVLHKLLGADNVTWPRLESLGTEFGCQPLIGKSAAIVSDLQLGDKANVQGIAATLLSVSGEDEQTINRKNKPHWTGRLATRFVLLSNKIPKLPDASGALSSRFIMLRFTESFEGREDLKLTDKLLTELTGIFNWALDGLDMLKANVKFKEPAAAADMKEAFEDLTSPIKAFIRDVCVVGPQYGVAKDELHAAWRVWSERQGRNFTTTKEQFSVDLLAAEPGITTTRPRGKDGESRTRRYQGIGLARDDEAPL